MHLTDITFKKALAYPVIQPSINWLVSSLLLWEEIVLIWDPSDMENMKRYAAISKIFMDNGLVTIRKPSDDEIKEALKELQIIRERKNKIKIPTDDLFSIHIGKTTPKYWKKINAILDSEDKFIYVPDNMGRLYMGLLANQMGKRNGNALPTLTERVDEPIFLQKNQYLDEYSTSKDKVSRIAHKVLIPDKDLRLLEASDIQKLCREIYELRKLDGWHSWRKYLLESQTQILVHKELDNPEYFVKEFNERVAIFQKEGNKQKLPLLTKFIINVAGVIIPTIMGSTPGIVSAATTGISRSIVDKVDTVNRKKISQSTPEQFVLKTRTILRKYQ